jgi:hypothetical protein
LFFFLGGRDAGYWKMGGGGLLISRRGVAVGEKLSPEGLVGVEGSSWEKVVG